jgi:hypothetical protein
VLRIAAHNRNELNPNEPPSPPWFLISEIRLDDIRPCRHPVVVEIERLRQITAKRVRGVSILLCWLFGALILIELARWGYLGHLR